MMRALKYAIPALLAAAAVAWALFAVFQSYGLVVVLLLLAYIPAVAFPVVYAFAPWWRSAAGRSVMSLSVVIALALSLSVWRVFWGAQPEWVRVGVFALIIPALWGQFVVLLLAPRMNRRRLAALPPEPVVS